MLLMSAHAPRETEEEGGVPGPAAVEAKTKSGDRKVDGLLSA
jgi:hypothetical protein